MEFLSSVFVGFAKDNCSVYLLAISYHDALANKLVKRPARSGFLGLLTIKDHVDVVGVLGVFDIHRYVITICEFCI